MKTKNSCLIAGLLLATLTFAPVHAQMRHDRRDQPDMVVDAALRQQVIDNMLAELNKRYVFPELAKKVDADIRQRQQRGQYDAITSAEKLGRALTEHVQALTKDKHLNMFYSAKPLPVEQEEKEPTPEERAQRVNMLRSQNFGVERLERLPHNIGYLQLNGFAPAKEAAETIAAAMTVLAHTEALIIDLRKNGGGHAATVTLLASYLLDKRTHMSDIYEREGDTTEQMWSSDVVAGRRYGQKKEVYILTSKRTFSAAEDFSYAMKNLKRATIIGETTGGGAHPGGVMRLTTNFAMFIPTGRSIGPVTKTNWEGVGVAPDIEVAADEAMKTAQVAILKKMAAAEKAGPTLDRLTARIAQVEGENSTAAVAR